MPPEWKAPLITIAVTIAVLIVGGAVWFFWFSGDSAEDIAATVKTDMQSYFATDADVQKYRITVKDVTLIEATGNEYNGIATVRTASGTTDHKIPITVTWDGKKGLWQTERGALLFLMSERPAA